MLRSQTLLLILSLLIQSESLPQHTSSTQYVDQQTYFLFLQSDWDELIRLGDQAIKEGIDFYYLHYRMGIAWYSKMNYTNALKHFYKAFDTNPDDPLLLEYLYFSNTFLDRKQEARLQAAAMTRDQRQHLGIEDMQLLDKVEFVWQINQVNSSEAINQFDPDPLYLTDGTQSISVDHQYLGIFLMHPVTPRFSIYHGYAHLQKNHFFFSQTDTQRFINRNATSNLNQYYISGIARLGRNLTMVAGFHYINIRYPVEETTSMEATSFITTRTMSLNDFVGCLSLYKHTGKITAGASFISARLNQASQLQGDGVIVWYPLGNMNLYTVSTLSLQSETDDITNTSSTRHVIYQRIGGRPVRPLWLEASISVGDMQNFLRHDGQVVFNAMDMIKRQTSGKIIYQLTANLSINLAYTLTTHESAFRPAVPNAVDQNRLSYNSQSLTGGITWIF